MDNQELSSFVPPEAAKMIQDAVFWYEQRTGTLADIAGCDGQVVLASSGHENIEFDSGQSAAFRAGIKTALSILGEFPLKLDKPITDIDVTGLDEAE